MAEWIEGVKCVHQITCGIMLSLLLSLAIRAHINFASSSCDTTGLEMDAGSSSCQMTNDRIWSLSIFYSGAVVFGVGILATCMSNGYMVILYMLGMGTWIGVIVGITIYRMISDDAIFMDAFMSISEEVIPEKWEIYSTIVEWVLAISLAVTLVTCIIMVFHFLHYKYI